MLPSRVQCDHKVPDSLSSFITNWGEEEKSKLWESWFNLESTFCSKYHSWGHEGKEVLTYLK